MLVILMSLGKDGTALRFANQLRDVVPKKCYYCVYEELLLATIDVTCSLRSLSKHTHHLDYNCVCPSTETQASFCAGFGAKRSDSRTARGGKDGSDAAGWDARL